MTTLTITPQWVHAWTGKIIPSEAIWNSADPFALKVIFADTTRSAEWTFALDLALDAFKAGTATVGIGDVQLQHMEGRLYITLTSSEGTITVSTEGSPFHDFLLRAATASQYVDLRVPDFINWDDDTL